MSNWFISNREFIKGLAFNTGTSSNPTYTQACTSSEISLETDFEEKTFYVFCDAIQRTILTGGSLKITGTMKLDLNNTANITLLSKIHSFIVDGEIYGESISIIKRCKWLNNDIYKISRSSSYQIK